MKKRQILIPALLAIAMSGSLIAGATYSLFTSSVSHDITVSSGKVNLESKIDTNSLALSSLGKEQETYFANGGTAKFEGNVLQLINITPGDSVTFDINMRNFSTVSIKYKVSLRCKSGAELFAGLTITPDINKAWSGPVVPDANPADPVTETTTVTVTLPKEAGNEYQGLNSEIVINVEAVQANATDYNPTNPDLNKAEDEVTAARMSNVLKGNKPSTMKEAVDTLKSNNPSYDLEAIKPIYEQSRFAYNLKDNKVITILDSELDSKKSADTWLIVHSEEEMTTLTEKYSVYLAKDFVESGDKTLAPKLGLDMGSIDANYTINYDNDSTAKVVNFNTNTGTLNVNAGNDTVNHYGVSHNVNITNVAKNSYHEFGEVLGNINLTAGRVVTETGSKVASVVIKATDVEKVKVEDKTETNVTVVATDQTVAQNISKAVTGTTNAKKEKVEEATLSKFAGGLGTEKSPYLISNYNDLNNINLLNEEMKNGKYFYFLLTNDIDLTKEKFNYNNVVPIFNGKLVGLTNSNTKPTIYSSNSITYLFLYIMNHSVFKDFNLHYDTQNITYLYKTMFNKTRTFNDTNITLDIDNVDIIGYKDTTYKFLNRNDCVYYTNARTVVFIEEISKSDYITNDMLLSNGELARHHVQAKTINCDVDANYTATAGAAIFDGGQNYGTKVLIENCTYSGTYIGSKPALVFANGTGFTQPKFDEVWTECIVRNVKLLGKIIKNTSIDLQKGNIAFSDGINTNQGSGFAEKYKSIEEGILNKENYIISEDDPTLAIGANENHEYIITASSNPSVDSYSITLKTGRIDWNNGSNVPDSYGYMTFNILKESINNTGVYKARSIAKSQVTPELGIDISTKKFENVTENGVPYEFVLSNDNIMYFVLDLSKLNGGNGTYSNINREAVAYVSANINGVSISTAKEIL